MAAIFLCMLAGPALGGNLLTNGDFERGDLTGWTIDNPGNHRADAGLTTDSARVHGGGHAFAINRFDGGKDVLRLITGAPVAGMPEGTLIRTRIMIATTELSFDDSKAGCALTLVILDRAGQPLMSVPCNQLFVGTHPYTAIEILASLPPDAAEVSLRVVAGAGIRSGSIQVDDASIEPVTDLGPARADLPRCEVRADEGGTPRLWINGRRRAPVIFFGNYGSPVIYEEIAKAATAGVDIVQVPMNLPWNGASTGMLAQAVQANPRALFLPRVFLHPPAGWIERHKDQLILNDEGKSSPANNYASLASDVFFDECKRQIEAFIRFLENSPYGDRIIGYHPDYLAECFFYYEMDQHFYDYSEVNRRRFTRWLAGKYGEVARLNAAWGAALTSFDDARIPPAEDWKHGDDGVFRDPANPRAVAVADYQVYFNSLTADRMIELAELIKRLTSDRSLVGYFYGMQNEFVVNGHENGIPQSGHLGTRRVLASPAIDLLCAPTSYHDRAPGGTPNMMGVVDSVTLAGKIYLEEDDSRTWLWEEPPQPDYWTLKTPWDTLQCLRRNFGNVLGHNQAIWWMDLCANGSYNSSLIWDNNRKLVEAYTDSIEQALPTRPQVALIYDEDIFFWLKANCRPLTAPSLVTQRSVFQALGAQVGYYYIEDLPRIPDSARLIVFVSTIHMDAKKEALVEAMKRDGRTLLWLYAPGYVGEHDLSLERVERLTGFELAKYDPPIQPAIEITPGPHAISQALAGRRMGTAEEIKPLAPTFHGDEADSGSIVLGRYEANGKPAVLLQEHPGWTSIFYGSPLLSVPLLRAICREAGVALLVDGEDLDAQDAVSFNGRYLCVYARGHKGPRAFQLPAEQGPLDVTEIVSGREIGRALTRWSDDFEQNEQKIYRLTPGGER